MFAVPLRDIVRIHATSGTTGKPIVVGYTKNDVKHWSSLVARLLAAVNVTEMTWRRSPYNYSLFTGGLGFHYGAELLGASVIPAAASGSVREQLAIMKDFKTTVLLTMPSYALTMANQLDAFRIPAADLFLKCGYLWRRAVE